MKGTKRMKRNRFLPAFLAAVMAASALTLPAAAEDKLTQFKPTDDNVKYIGRSVYSNDELWFGLTDSGVSFDFTGKHAEMNLMGDNAAFSERDGARIKVYADGEVVYDKCLTEYPFETITVDFDKEGEHTVKLLKVSECANNTVLLENIFTDSDSIKPSANGSHTIEFVGDSITCGYGVDADSEREHFLTSTEDGTKTYAYKTAQHFNADYSMVSYSGCGAVSAYTTGSTPNTQNLMKDFYELVGHSYGSTGNGSIDINKWGFETSPELIVINIGTNDNSYTKGKAERVEEFKSAYADLIKQIRGKNPDSEILCVLGLMGNQLYPAITEVVDSYKSESGDSKINCLELDSIAPDDGYGADYHPKEVSHERAAGTLIKKIEELYGWTDHDPAMQSAKKAAAESSAPDSSSASDSKASVKPIVVICISVGALLLVLVAIRQKKKA